MRGTRARESGRDRPPLLHRSLRKALPQPAVARVDANPVAALRVCEPHLADVLEHAFTRVADLDGEDVVPAGEVEEPVLPVERASEVGDQGDEGPLAARPILLPRALGQMGRPTLALDG